jgi:protein TonB
MLDTADDYRPSVVERLAPAAARLAMLAAFVLAAIWVVRTLATDPSRQTDVTVVTILEPEPPPKPEPAPQPAEPEPMRTAARLLPLAERDVTPPSAEPPARPPEPQPAQAAGPPAPASVPGTPPGLADEGDPRGELQGSASASGDGPVSLSEGAGDATGSGGTEPPRFEVALLQNPKPGYPAAARARGQEGTVLVWVLVGEDGTPEQVQVKESSGWNLLDRAAVDAIKKWRFAPAQRGGKPVADWVLVPVRFRLEG